MQKKQKKIRNIVLIVLSILILFRIFLPFLVLKYVNNKLSNLTEYHGNVRDIDIALFRGAYIIKDLKIVKINKKNRENDTIPFFECPKIDLSVEWKAIFKGAIVGEIYIEDPRLNFVKEVDKEEKIKADTADFRQVIKDLMPLTINYFEIANGQIHFIDNTIKPGIDVAILNIEVIAENLTNLNDSVKLLPAHLHALGNAYEGNFILKIDFDPLNKVPTFDLNFEVSDLNLVKLNDFLSAYGNFTVEKGRFGLYAEFAAKNGGFGGYVKPLIKDMKVSLSNEKEGLKDKLWALMVAGVAEIFKNKETDNLASKIPIEGTFRQVDTNMWRAVSFLLRNAFISALKPTIDQSININKLEENKPKTLLEKIFKK